MRHANDDQSHRLRGIPPESSSGRTCIHIQTQGDTVRDFISIAIVGTILVACAAMTGSVQTMPQAVASPAPASQSAPASRALGAVVGVSEHSNVVNLEVAEGSESAISSVNFTWNGGYSITSGQPWGGVTSSTGSENGLAYVNVSASAGRSGSQGPASWFSQNEVVNVADDTFLSAPGAPSDLNFAFTGTLTINGHDYPIVLGQGHQSATNNWWFGGGSGWTNNRGALVTPDGAYRIQGYSDSANAFAISTN